MLYSVRAACYSLNVPGAFPPWTFAFVVSPTEPSLLKTYIFFKAQLKCSFIYKTRPKWQRLHESLLFLGTDLVISGIFSHSLGHGLLKERPYVHCGLSLMCLFHCPECGRSTLPVLIPFFPLGFSDKAAAKVCRQTQGQCLNWTVGTGNATLSFAKTALLYCGQARQPLSGGSSSKN